MNKFSFGIVFVSFMVSSVAFANRFKFGDEVLEHNSSDWYENYEGTVVRVYLNGNVEFKTMGDGLRIRRRGLYGRVPSYNGFKTGDEVHGLSWAKDIVEYGTVKKVFSNGWASVESTSGSLGYADTKNLKKPIPSYKGFEQGIRVSHAYAGKGTVEAVYTDGSRFFPEVRAQVKYDKPSDKIFPLVRKLTIIKPEGGTVASQAVSSKKDKEPTHGVWANSNHRASVEPAPPSYEEATRDDEKKSSSGDAR